MIQTPRFRKLTASLVKLFPFLHVRHHGPHCTYSSTWLMRWISRAARHEQICMQYLLGRYRIWKPDSKRLTAPAAGSKARQSCWMKLWNKQDWACPRCLSCFLGQASSSGLLKLDDSVTHITPTSFFLSAARHGFGVSDGMPDDKKQKGQSAYLGSLSGHCFSQLLNG